MVAAATISCKDDTSNGGNTISVTRGEITLAAGETVASQFKIPASDTPQLMVFTSGDPQIFHVDTYTGSVTGLKPGTATLSVNGSRDKQLFGEYKVTVTQGSDIKVSELQLISAGSFSMYLNGTYDLSQLKFVVRPAYATNKVLKYEITTGADLATVDSATGLVTATGLGSIVVTISTTDGSNLSKTVNGTIVRQYFPRSAWTIETSHPTQTGDAVSGGWQQLIDDPAKGLCMGLGKPGRVLDANAVVWFVIDMKEVKTFNAFEIRHRDNASYPHLNVWSADIEVSDDGVTFTTVESDVDLRPANGLWTYPNTVIFHKLPAEQTARYFKFTYKSWQTTSGNYMQTNDFNIGYFN
jgi:hypothetical protein